MTFLTCLSVLAFSGCGEAENNDYSSETTHYEIIKSGLIIPSETEQPSANIEETTPIIIPETKKISFLAAGDNMIHMSVYTDAMARADKAAAEVSSASGQNIVGKYYFDEMYTDIADLVSTADISFVNQEGPIAGENFGISGHPNFNAPDSAGDTLVNLGFDIVNIANNHMLDMDTIYRGTGLLNSINYWKNKDVLLLGGYGNKDN